MKLFSEVMGFLAIYFNIYVMFYGYNVTSKNRKKVDIKYLIVVGLVALSILIANNYTDPVTRLIITIMSQVLGYWFVFREKVILVLFKTFIMFVLLNLCDMLAASLYILFPFNDSSEIIMKNISYFRTLNTCLVSLIMSLLFLIKSIKVILNKLFNYVNQKLSYVFLLIACLSCISFLVITYLNSVVLNLEILVQSLFLIIFVLFLCFIMIYQYFKNKQSEEEQKNLLELMTEYEIMLDKDRINRHEMLNNLVALKSYKNKSSKDFEEMLDGIIRNYEDKKSQVYSNLYNLPSGIKGIVYYKMNIIKESNINFNLLISKDVENKFENLNQKLYLKVCKILGIVLDNAIEASTLTKDKLLLVDIYLEEENLVIYVENTFINLVDLNIIYNKGVSSKGKNRGYGLYLVKRIVNDTNELEFEQSINNDRFTTILKIKNPRD